MNISIKISKTKILIFITVLSSLILAKDISFRTKTTVMILLMSAAMIPVNIVLNKRLTVVFLTLLIMLTPLLTVFLSQFVLNAPMPGPDRIFWGTVPVLILMMGIIVISNNIELSSAMSSALWLAVSTVNWFVFVFRGAELTVRDFLSLRTAANVAGSYSYSPSSSMVYAWCIFMVFLSFIMSFRREKLVFRNMRIVAAIGMILASVCFFMGTSSISVMRWRENGSHKNGFILNFCLDITKSRVEIPEGYSLSSVDQITSDYLKKNEQAEEDYPNVVVIMNEAFADFSVYGDNYRTNQDVWSFYHSLEQNAVKGFALTSVFGGGTANSEYEFLTGNTMAFLPYGAVPYMQYIKDNTWSLVSYFNELGYETVGVHPYISTGWKRNTVYPQLGFSDSVFQEDFPQDDLLRGYVPDAELYRWVVEKIQESQSKKFIFAVSMQNHSAYGQPEWEEYRDNSLHFPETIDKYEDVKDYLTLQKISDNALQYLVESLKKINSKTVLVVFGDHQPRLNDAFYNELAEDNSLESQQLRYKVPFLVWANYDVDIGEQNIPLTSLNYLAEYMFEVSGIPKPAYFEFLSDIRKDISAINRNGYYMGENACTSIDTDGGEESSSLEKYRLLEYNFIFDKQKSAFFSRK